VSTNIFLSFFMQSSFLSDPESLGIAYRARELHRQYPALFDAFLNKPDQPDTDLTAVIPARNEAGSIAEVIMGCRRFAAQVLVVEGGSTDNTAKIASEAGAQVIRDSGLGKGAALRLAVENVTTPICVFVDADGSHNPLDIPLLVAPIHDGRAIHVHGSRLRGGSDELHGGWDEFFRLAGSAFITCLINLRFNTRLSDSQNGFRAIRTDAFRSLSLHSKHTTIEMELIMASLSAGHILLEVPTHERPRTAGYSKIYLGNPLTWLAYGSALLSGLYRAKAVQTTLSVTAGA
jgi:dolichol-phosphate hexosyltransferase